jgi:hypothetical protein
LFDIQIDTQGCSMSDALCGLPMAWLHCLATKVTAESAARLRTTCKLLQLVGCCAAVWGAQQLLLLWHILRSLF